MSVEHVYCPGCGAPISISTGTTESKCGYCGSSFRVQRSDGEVALILSNNMTKAFADASAQTKAAIDESSALTRDELRRMQLVAEMSNLEVRLTSIESEIRSVQRLPATKVTTRQLQQLQVEALDLQERITEVRAILFPEPEREPELDSAASIPGPSFHALLIIAIVIIAAAVIFGLFMTAIRVSPRQPPTPTIMSIVLPKMSDEQSLTVVCQSVGCN